MLTVRGPTLSAMRFCWYVRISRTSSKSLSFKSTGAILARSFFTARNRSFSRRPVPSPAATPSRSLAFRLGVLSVSIIRFSLHLVFLTVTVCFFPLPFGRPPNLPHSCIRLTNSRLPHCLMRASALRRPIRLAASLIGSMHTMIKLTLDYLQAFYNPSGRRTYRGGGPAGRQRREPSIELLGLVTDQRSNLQESRPAPQ